MSDHHSFDIETIFLRGVDGHALRLSIRSTLDSYENGRPPCSNSGPAGEGTPSNSQTRQVIATRAWLVVLDDAVARLTLNKKPSEENPRGLDDAVVRRIRPT
jgi:hypothetical protein